MPEAFKWKDPKPTSKVCKHQALYLALPLLCAPTAGLRSSLRQRAVLSVCGTRKASREDGIVGGASTGTPSTHVRTSGSGNTKQLHLR